MRVSWNKTATLLATLAPLALMLHACSSEEAADIIEAVLTVPGAPTISGTVVGDTQVDVVFIVPDDDGGSSITGYTASCTGGGETITASGPASPASPVTVTGLTNDVSYSCSVTAENGVGTSDASSAVVVSPSDNPLMSASTGPVDCAYSGSYTGVYGQSGTLTSTWSWSCTDTTRTITANGLPAHDVGDFPRGGNPNTITTQTVNRSFTLDPIFSGTTVLLGPGGADAFSREGVLFNPGTGGTCPDTVTATTDCDLGNTQLGTWRIEALGQETFSFGVDDNNAHVNPEGVYHYHGLPEGIVDAAGVDEANPAMVHVGWASDGYPVYARYCYSDPMDATSALKVCEGSYEVDTEADSGRPDVDIVPLGVFLSDWNYVAGSGDLDECNGRTGVTPEFPEGIYYYMGTDDYPFFSRCVKGNLN